MPRFGSLTGLDTDENQPLVELDDFAQIMLPAGTLCKVFRWADFREISKFQFLT